uniref:O-methyltransferase domain-containing protein n=1 Tax=Oryza nivara TaxID=4536 RepID=A0A0E0J148_ORYNI
MSSSTTPISPQLVSPTDDELLQAQANLWRHSLYYLTSMALRCAVKLGIPTAIHRLGGNATLPALITALSLPPAKLPFLRRLMRLLVSSGVFTTERGGAAAEAEAVYGLAPLSLFLVDGAFTGSEVDDGHTNQSAFVLAATSAHYVEAALGLDDWFMKDNVPAAASPFEAVHGAPLLHETPVDAELNRLVSEALVSQNHMGIGLALRESRRVFEGLESLVDCGGGDGAAARAIVRAFPGIKCTVLDLPQVIGTAPVADGAVDYVAGDMFSYIPPAQAVLLKYVLSHWSDDDCVKILAQCKKAIPSREAGGKVIIKDVVVGTSSGLMLEAELLMDMAMMVMTSGRERDEQEWREIFTNAGFSDYKIMNKLGARCVIEVYP